MKLYWGSGSPYAWRVMLGLVLKELEFESVLLEFSKGEHKSPEYLEVNPRGKVPALVDGDLELYESLAILAYLDRKHPERPLFGRAAAEHGLVWRQVFEHENYLRPAAFDFARPAFRGTAADEADAVRAAAETLHGEMARLEECLEAAPFLAGDAVSAADAVLYPTIRSLQRALGKPGMDAIDHGFAEMSSRYPSIAAWQARFEAFPDIASADPPHWRT